MSAGVGRGMWFSDNQSDSREKSVGRGFGVNKDHSVGNDGFEKPDTSPPSDSGWEETQSSDPIEHWGGGDENKPSGGGWNNGQERGGFGNRGRGGRSGFQNRDGGGGRGGFGNRDENGGGGRGGYRNRDEGGGGGRGGYRNRDENGGGGGGRGGYRNRGENDGDGSNDYQNGYRGGRGGGGRGRSNRDDNDGDSNNRGWNNRDNQQNGERSFRGRGGGYRNRDNGDSGERNWEGGDGSSFGNKDGDESTDRGWGGSGDNNDDQSRRGRGGFGRGGRGRGGFNSGEGHGGDDDNSSGGGFRPRNDSSDNDGEDQRPKVPVYIPPELPEDEVSIFAASIPSGINFCKLGEVPVKMTGNNVPAPITSFEDSGLRPLLKENVRKAGYKVPTPVQKNSIPAIIANRDLMSCAQTGSGKTAAFLLPILHTLMEANYESGCFEETQAPYCLILGPTRELISQIFQEARKFAYGSCIKVVVLYGGVLTGHQLRKLEQGCHICVATPGRLLQILRMGKMSFKNLRYLVLDEADRMLDMGFKENIAEVVGHRTMPPKENRRTLMFSATFPEDIQHMAREYLEDYLFLTVGMIGGANADVKQEIILVEHSEKRDKLLEIIAGGKRVLVFIEQKRQADFVSSIICQSPGLSATSIHGDRYQQQREEALEDFKTGRRQVLVATSVASRGLDIKDVEHVINYDMPKDINEYVHRIGRTGRVGNLGRATSFYNPETDGDMAKPLLKVLVDANQEVPSWLEEEAKKCVGGGGGGYGRSRFGGQDIRSNKEIRGNSGPPEEDHWGDNDKGVQESESWD